MDWTIFHALNGTLRGDDAGQDAAQIFNACAIFVLLAIAAGLWLLGRPGGSMRSKLAAVSAAAAGVLGLVFNEVLGQLWYQNRPFVDHSQATVLIVHHAPDNSFPSDHASVAFAVAFAVCAFHRKLGAFLVAGAAAIGLDRIFVGVHYPVDVLASVGVGLVAAIVVTTAGRRPVAWTAAQLSRLTDPVVALVLGRPAR